MSEHARRRTVLVVDDDPFIRLMAAEMAEDAHFIALQASDADEAMEILETSGEVGILFTDVHIPGSMTGFRLAELVHARWPQIELIITSGELRPQQKDIPDSGMFLPKPYSEAQVVSALNEMTSRKPH